MPDSPVRRFAVSPFRLLAGLAASGVVGALAYRRGSLSGGGVAGAMLVGTTIFSGGGLTPSVLVLTFFTSSSALSHWRKRRQRESEVEHAKGERRDFAQVIANGGVAAALVALGRARPDSPWFPALIGALATVNADTWATELGLFSPQPPRLVTTWRTVAPGTSGGITPLGTGASALGAVLIGTVAALCAALPRQQTPHQPTGSKAITLALASGLVGSLADSLLGATIQARYHCPTCDAATERPLHRCGTPTTPTGGYRWIDNDAVNLAASLCGAAIGWLWGVAIDQRAKETMNRQDAKDAKTGRGNGLKVQRLESSNIPRPTFKPSNLRTFSLGTRHSALPTHDRRLTTGD